MQDLALMVARIGIAAVALMAGILPTLGQAPGDALRPLAPATPTLPAPGEIREGAAPPGSKGTYIVEQSGNTLLATEYIGRAVQGPGGTQVGTVSNLIVDTTGRITGILLDVGGFLGFGGKEVAIVFEALYPVMEDGKEMLVVEMTKDQLAAAPPFKPTR